MSIINLAIGRSKYQIDCADGEEEKINKLAARLNERINKLTLNLRGADEKTILMLCAIMIEEEAENLKKKVDKNYNGDDENAKLINEEELYKSIAENMENIADYIEKLANKIKHY
jgi:cell division protein ZapA (FtsZ GTPase activity inhibitor)